MAYQFRSREYVAMLRAYFLSGENASAAVRMYREDTRTLDSHITSVYLITVHSTHGHIVKNEEDRRCNKICTTMY